MPQTGTEYLYYLLLFFLSGFLGWCMEVAVKLVQYHRFINRGFLIGPICPIYGVGSVCLTLLLSRFTQDPFAVFGLAILICGTLEYLTSYIMEKLFHARWWDYSQKRFNLNGRVCADTLIPFGLLGLGMIYFVKPVVFSLFARLSDAALEGICIALTVLLAVDYGLSVWALVKIRLHAENAEGDSTEAITAHVRDLLREESFLVRRALRAFPEARLYNSRLIQRLKEAQQALKAEAQELKEAAQEKRDELRESAQEKTHQLAATAQEKREALALSAQELAEAAQEKREALTVSAQEKQQKLKAAARETRDRVQESGQEWRENRRS